MLAFLVAHFDAQAFPSRGTSTSDLRRYSAKNQGFWATDVFLGKNNVEVDFSVIANSLRAVSRNLDIPTTTTSCK